MHQIKTVAGVPFCGSWFLPMPCSAALALFLGGRRLVNKAETTGGLVFRVTELEKGEQLEYHHEHTY